MKPTSILRQMEHPRRFAYPRRIWYPTTTYWEGARYGMRNLVVVFGLLGIFYSQVVLPIGFKYEVHYDAPTHPTWYMRFNRQYKDDPYGEKMFAGKERYKPLKDEH